MCHGECTWAEDSCKENKPLPVYKGSPTMIQIVMMMILIIIVVIIIVLAGCPMCLTGMGENLAMGMEKCQWVEERQLLEVGNFYPNEDGLGKYTLRPIGGFWILFIDRQYLYKFLFQTHLSGRQDKTEPGTS